jgi:hypothetical protein
MQQEEQSNSTAADFFKVFLARLELLQKCCRFWQACSCRIAKQMQLVGHQFYAADFKLKAVFKTFINQMVELLSITIIYNNDKYKSSFLSQSLHFKLCYLVNF